MHVICSDLADKLMGEYLSIFKSGSEKNIFFKIANAVNESLESALEGLGCNYPVVRAIYVN